jgi:hypothetical protein
MTTDTIDLTPTWGEVGNMYVRLAESGEVAAIRRMRSEAAKAFAAAQAFTAIQATLSEEQRAIASGVLTTELSKMGYWKMTLLNQTMSARAVQLLVDAEAQRYGELIRDQTWSLEHAHYVLTHIDQEKLDLFSVAGLAMAIAWYQCSDS